MKMYNGVWIKKPWFWTERYLLTHPYWIGIGMLWIPIPFGLGVFLFRLRFVRAKLKTKILRKLGLVYDPDKNKVR